MYSNDNRDRAETLTSETLTLKNLQMSVFRKILDQFKASVPEGLVLDDSAFSVDQLWTCKLIKPMTAGAGTRPLAFKIFCLDMNLR